MRDSIYRISLDIHNDSTQVQIVARKNDTARRIYATFMEHGKPFVFNLNGARAVITIKKPDGFVLQADCDIRSDGTVIYDFTDLTTDVVGLCTCMIDLTYDDMISSGFFTILVTETAYDADSKSAVKELREDVDALKIAEEDDKKEFELIKSKMKKFSFASDEYVTVENLMDMSASQIYALFDYYRDGGIVSRRTIGYASAAGDPTAEGNEKAQPDTSLPIYSYKYTRSEAAHVGYEKGAKKTILFTCCIHGPEKLGIPFLLTLLKCIKDKSNPGVNHLAELYDIEFVPVVNPYGCDLSIGTTYSTAEANVGRTNARGVNIARNFEYGWLWQGSGDGPLDYKGPAPLSECESEAMHTLLVDDNANYVLFVDLHTTRYGSNDAERNSRCVVANFGASSSMLRSLFSNTISGLKNKIKNEYGLDLSRQTFNIAGALDYYAMMPQEFASAKGDWTHCALYEGPRYNNGVIYSEGDQKMTADILLLFLGNYDDIMIPYTMSRSNVISRVNALQKASGNVLDLTPTAWIHGFHGTDPFFNWDPRYVTTRSTIPLIAGKRYKARFFTTIARNMNFYVRIVNKDSGTLLRTIDWRSDDIVFVAPDNSCAYFNFRDNLAGNEIDLADIGLTYLPSLEMIDTGDLYTLRKLIPDGTDLFSLPPEKYYCKSIASAKSMTNCPVEMYFNLDVEPIGSPSDNFRLFTLRTETDIYINRVLASGSANAWRKATITTV